MATLITGGAGYIGSHIVVAVHQSGRNAVLLDDFSGSSPHAVDAVRRLTSPILPTVEGDASDCSVLRDVINRYGIDSVIHLAAFKNMPESLTEPLRYYRNNLASAISVAEVAAESGVRSLVFSSSAAVYGTPASAPVTEDSALAPSNPYGRTKLMGEQIMADAATAFGLDVVLLRYFNPVGAHPSGVIGEDPAGQPGGLVPRVMQTAAGRHGPVLVFGSDYNTPDGTAVRDYIHVVDLAEGHLAALDARTANAAEGAGAVGTANAAEGAGAVGTGNAAEGALNCAVYNLGTGVGSSVLQVIAAASSAVGRPIPHEMADRRPGDVASIWADCRRARHELGWTARYGLAAMLRDHWNWQKHHPDGYST